ncbi:hypothetical protein F5887DRAFT_920587 [Amanita rubescens]|nr:hypothetical protein F5887DRAFT_920587 [Amanita rubescens]
MGGQFKIRLGRALVDAGAVCTVPLAGEKEQVASSSRVTHHSHSTLAGPRKNWSEGCKMDTTYKEKIQLNTFINGKFVDGSTDSTHTEYYLQGSLWTRTTGQVITKVPEGTAAEVDLAVAAAKKSIIAELVDQNKEELPALGALDNVIKKVVDIPVTVVTFKYFAGWADKIHSKTIGVTPNLLRRQTRESLLTLGTNLLALLSNYSIRRSHIDKVAFTGSVLTGKDNLQAVGATNVNKRSNGLQWLLSCRVRQGYQDGRFVFLGTVHGPLMSKTQSEMDYIKSGKDQGVTADFPGKGQVASMSNPSSGVVVKFEDSVCFLFFLTLSYGIYHANIVKKANDSIYSLAAYVFSENVNRAIESAHDLGLEESEDNMHSMSIRLSSLFISTLDCASKGRVLRITERSLMQTRACPAMATCSTMNSVQAITYYESGRRWSADTNLAQQGELSWQEEAELDVRQCAGLEDNGNRIYLAG